ASATTRSASCAASAMAMPDAAWVLDTSVAAAWFLTDDEQHADADRVLEAARTRPDDFAVPELFYSELIHVLATRSGHDAEFVLAAIELVMDLGLRTLPLTREAIARTVNLACAGLAGYDATFVALAESFSATWLTADERAAQVVPGSSATIRATQF